MEFTTEQKQVIEERDSSILVSAAAGSGKTTVLVERIIQKILGSKEGSKAVDIDRILVLTFTNAAAAHMREKIEAAILDAIAKDPDNEHLLKQESLIHNAQITTIHSFCLFLLRNNFTKISLDPGFRVADEGEIKLLKELIADRVIEELFENNAIAGFEDLANRFARKNKLSRLKEVILKVYGESESEPFFEEFVEKRRNDYYIDGDSFGDTEWGKYLLKLIKARLEDAKTQAMDLLEHIQTFAGAVGFLHLVEKEANMLEAACELETFEEIQNFLNSYTFDTFRAKKVAGDIPEELERTKIVRKSYKDLVDGTRDKYAKLPLELMQEGIKENYRIVNILMDVVEYFDAELRSEKQKRKIIDFTDMEHLALKVLLEKKDGVYVPTREALDYRDYFDEIMVDEYQDSNKVQEYILSTISGEENGRFNRFMVGDVKQSIYGFRKACPEIFLDKYDRFTDEKSDSMRIILSKNYRSRDEVVDAVNCICEKLIAKDLGDIEYDDAARLYRGADYPETECDNKAKLMILEQSKEIADNKKSAEAMMIAGKINELVNKHMVRDEETKTMRPCMYKDIVILLRSGSEWDEQFKKTLESQGIPTYIESKKGYFSSTEVKVLLNYLSTIDNPRKEIDLFGAMVSPIGGFDDEEVARIRNFNRGNLYDTLRLIADGESGELEQAIVDKTTAFINKLEAYRSRVAYDSISKLITDIIEDSGYMFSITSMPYGEQRKANILMLAEMAKQYEMGSFKGLYHFIRYIEELKNYDLDMGEATTLDEKSNVVRIMTMHKSKGLEFPVCFISGLAKGFNTTDENDSIIFDRNLGIGLEYVDIDSEVKYRDIRCSTVRSAMRLNMLAEEIRVLYVALTRAQEKLYLTATVDSLEKFEEKKTKLMALCDGCTHLPWSVRSGAGSFLDMIIGCIDDKSKQYIDYEEYTVDDIDKMTITQRITKAVRRENIVSASNKEVVKDDILSAVLDRIGFEYEHKNLADLYTKTSVSELKIAAIHDGLLHNELEEVPSEFFAEHDNNAYIPNFAGREEKIKGTTRGSAYHRVMELISFKDIDLDSQKYDIANLIEAEISSGRIDREEAELVDVNKVVKFFESDLGQRMCDAARRGELYLEEPFVLNISADRLDKKYPKEESVLIQGIIDAFFIENGKIILMDYKTDSVKNAEALVDRYKVQLDYYTEALERIRGMEVKERLIYSFALASVIAV